MNTYKQRVVCRSGSWGTEVGAETGGCCLSVLSTSVAPGRAGRC